MSVHPISVVTRRTGLTQDLLRAWEKRYEAVTPTRTPTGRRLYTEADIEKLRLLKQLVDGGRRISDVAGLDIEALQALAREDEREAVVNGPVRRPTDANGRSYLARCVDAVDRLDRDDLEHTLSEAGLALSPARVRRDVLVPFIRILGDRWEDGSWRVVHEHLASAILRAVLWDMVRRGGTDLTGNVLVVATPSGQRHELGALLAAGLATELGWDVLYLGADLPAEEIAAAVLAKQARGVLLSVVFPKADGRTADEIRRLRALVGEQTPLLVGGRAAGSYQDVLVEVGALVASDLPALGQQLRELAA